MAKRFGDFSAGCSKRQKCDLDDLWGDDLNVQDVDDCLQLVSQMCEQEVAYSQRNTSILPTYNAFKQTAKRTFTSTQSNPELNSSITTPARNCHKPDNSVAHNNVYKRTNGGFDGANNLETKLRKVEDQCMAKEGEVSMLRGQLKEVKFQHDKEHVKREKEWSEKYGMITKQLTAVKSELEFKNLEIANLKQQVVGKINRDSALNNSFKQPRNLEKCTQQLNDSISTAIQSRTKQKECYQDVKINTARGDVFPLQNLIDSSLFCAPAEEKYSVDIKNRNTLPFLQNQLSQGVTDRLIEAQPKRILLPNGRHLNVDYIHSDIFNLMRQTQEELDTSRNYAYINKVVCVCEQLCDNLHKFMLELEKGLATDNSEEVDMLYLKNNFNAVKLNVSLFSPEDWIEREMGKSARQSIACMALILPYSSYLQKYLLQNKSLIFKGDEEYLHFLPVTKAKINGASADYNFINTLTSIMHTSGKLKNSHVISGFVAAVCLLLNKIYSCDVTQETHLFLTRLTREIVFVCPNVQVLCYLADFFQNAALNRAFVADLCKMSSKSSLKVDQIDKIVYYKQDVCVLQVFCVLVEYAMLCRKCDMILELYSSVMAFIGRCFTKKLKWLHYQENNHCACLTKMVKLTIDILYQVMEEYKKGYSRKNGYISDELSRLKHFLCNGIEVLQIFKGNVYDIIVKYVGLYSPYKVIIKSLMALKEPLSLTETHVERLETLMDFEETCFIQPDPSLHSLWN